MSARRRSCYKALSGCSRKSCAASPSNFVATLSRKKILVAVLLLAAFALAGGSLVASMRRDAPQASMAERASVARDPREAAVTLARMSDMQPASASLVAAPALLASSAAGAGEARCGEDQEPRFDFNAIGADGRFLQSKPGGVGYTGALRRLDAALRTSADPFDRELAVALNVDDVLAPDARMDALARDAGTGNDPRLYAVAFGACGNFALGHPNVSTPLACSRLDARHWAQLDAGNGVPWLDVLQQADTAGDRAGQQEALQRLASASRFDTHFGRAPAAVARLRVSSEDDVSAQLSLAAQAELFDLGEPFRALTFRCHDKADGDADMAAACNAIAAVMFDHSDSQLARAIGGSIHKQVTGDPTWLDRAHHEVHDYGELVGPQLNGPSECANARSVLKHWVRMGERGEVALMRESIAASAVRVMP